MDRFDFLVIICFVLRNIKTCVRLTLLRQIWIRNSGVAFGVGELFQRSRKSLERKLSELFKWIQSEHQYHFSAATSLTLPWLIVFKISKRQNVITPSEVPRFSLRGAICPQGLFFAAQGGHNMTTQQLWRSTEIFRNLNQGKKTVIGTCLKLKSILKTFVPNGYSKVQSTKGLNRRYKKKLYTSNFFKIRSNVPSTKNLR